MKLDQTALQLMRLAQPRQAIKAGARAAGKRFRKSIQALQLANRRRRELEALATWIE